MAELTGAAFTPEAILTLPICDGILIEKGGARRFRKANYLVDDLYAGLAEPHPMFAQLGLYAARKVS